MKALLASMLTAPSLCMASVVWANAEPSAQFADKMTAHRDCIVTDIVGSLRAEVQSGQINPNTNQIADQAVVGCKASREALAIQLRYDLKAMHPRLSEAGLDDATSSGLARFDELSSDFARSYAEAIWQRALEKSEVESSASLP